jgi:uncharacterized OsmC-like protein
MEGRMPRIRDVSVRTLANYQKEITAGSHTFIADEAEEDGGDGLGVSSFALLLSALGA